MGEIKRPLVWVEPGDTYQAGEMGVHIIEHEHSHSDLLRYIADDVGMDHLEALVGIMARNGLDIKQRVERELADVKSKATALLNFVGSSSYKKLSETQQKLLSAQLMTMQSYVYILQERLTYWNA